MVINFRQIIKLKRKISHKIRRICKKKKITFENNTWYSIIIFYFFTLMNTKKIKWKDTLTNLSNQNFFTNFYELVKNLNKEHIEKNTFLPMNEYIGINKEDGILYSEIIVKIFTYIENVKQIKETYKINKMINLNKLNSNSDIITSSLKLFDDIKKKLVKFDIKNFSSYVILLNNISWKN